VIFATLIGFGLGTLAAGPVGAAVGANIDFWVVGVLY
jgi:hypothetical protein